MIRYLALLSLVAFPSFAQAAPAPAAEDPHWLVKLVVANLLPLLITVLSPLLMAAMAYLSSYLRAKSAESTAAKVGLVFSEAANSIVAELNATLKPQILDAMKDGTVTKDELAKLKATALDALKTKLPATLMESAKGMFGGFVDTWLAGLIERSVTAQKQAPKVDEPVAPAAEPSPASP